MFDALRARIAESVRSYVLGPYSVSNPATASLFGPGPTSTGITINGDTALNSSAFWSAVAIISADVASVPLELIKRDANGNNTPLTSSKVYELVHDAPNPEMTSFVWREMSQGHALTWGNCYSEIQRDGAGRPVALWPITPDRVYPERKNGEIYYRVCNTDRGDIYIDAADMLHVPGLGYNGIMGYSVIEKARESIAMGIAMQRFGGSFFGNGSTFGGILTHPMNLDDKVKQNIRESVNAVHTGVDRAHKFLILGGGTKYERLGIPPNDAQFLESRRFEIEEIARWFHMPQHKLNGLDHATFSNIEHLDLEYYKSCLRAWYVRWEQELKRKLISPLERKQQYFKFNVEGFLRGDTASRTTYYKDMFGIGALSINDIREKEDLNSIGANGDEHFVPANFLPIKLAINPPEPAPATQQPAQPKGEPGGQPKRDDDELMLEMRTGLAALRTTTEALMKAIEAERSAVTEAERAQHATECETLRAKESDLQRELADIRQQLAERVRERDTALTERDTERTAREQTEADLQAHKAAATQHALDLEAAKTAAEKRCETAEAALTEAQKQLIAVTAQSETTTAERDAAVMAVAKAHGDLDAANEEARKASAAAADAQRELAEVTQRADVEATARKTADEARTAQHAATVERMTAVLGAHRALFVDAYGRMVRRETEKAKRHQGTPDKLKAWAEAFYATHEETCMDALRPAMRTHLAWKQSVEDVDAVLRQFLRPDILRALKQINAVAAIDTTDYPVLLERLLMRWESDRPQALADQLLADEVEHVRSQR